MILHSIFLTHIRYGILCWGRGNKTTLQPIHILLNRAIRCINFYKGKEGLTTKLYIKDNLLKAQEIFHLELAKFMYKFFNKLLPETFSSYFTLSKNIHLHNTRNIQNKLFVPRTQKNIGQKSISFMGTQLWNTIPQQIRSNKNLNLFIKQYKLSN